MTKNTVYLAGPIQHASDHGKGWRKRLRCGEISGSSGFDFIDPMAKFNTHELEYKEWTDEEIIDQDLELISESDAVLVHWLEVPTAGTPMELFFAEWIPKLFEAVGNAADEAAKRSSGSQTKQLVVQSAFERADLPYWMYEAYNAIEEDIPVAVQTTIPEEELSPWLTYHSDAITDSFSDALEWIDGNTTDRTPNAQKI